MTNQPLKDKRIAVLGGMGARPEAERKLIEELGLAELDWIHSEKNQGKPFANFSEGLRPGRYDYIFILTKFISHKSQNAVDRAKQLEIPVVRITGSYNTENFLAALFDQAIKKEEPAPAPEPPKPIITKVLEPAKPDLSNVPITEHTPEPNNYVKNWQKMFDAETPEKAKAKIELREKALEARIAKFKETKRDEKLISAAYNFYFAFEKFMDGFPLPTYLDDARQDLVKNLKKNSVAIEKPKKNTPPTDSDVLDALLRTNRMFSELYANTKIILEALSNPRYDKHGACEICKMNKTIGCMPNCPHENVKRLLQFFKEATNINAPDLSPKAMKLPTAPMPLEKTVVINEPMISFQGANPVPLESLPRKARRFFEKKFGI